MTTEQTERQSIQIDQEKLVAFVRTMIGLNTGREDDEHPLPPGPWDPVIRVALERIHVFGPSPDPWRVFGPRVSSRASESGFDPQPDPWRVFGPGPQPWRLILGSIVARHPEVWDAIGGGRSFGDEVALNPQPLPPRYAFLLAVSQAVISRAELLQEIADSTLRDGEQQGIIIVGGYTTRFSDEFCGTGFRLKYPFPGPRPNWFPRELDGIDLIVMGTQFEQAARETFSPGLRQDLAYTGARFVETGLSRMQ